ncbi:MAG TPA: hypothetical protein VF502_04270 [Stellaceae bacterium]
MSRQAQAERERQARVILDSAEAKIAQKFVEAALMPTTRSRSICAA